MKEIKDEMPFIDTVKDITRNALDAWMTEGLDTIDADFYRQMFENGIKCIHRKRLQSEDEE